MTAKRISEPLSAAATTLPGVAPPASTAAPTAAESRVASELEALVVAPTHQLDGIELRSLAGFAALFYGVAFMALAAGLAVVWVIAWAAGLVGKFEEFMRSIGFRDFQIVGPKLIFGGLLLALALIVFLTVMTVLAGALYNAMANTGRAVRVRVSAAPLVDSDPPPERSAGESVPRALLRALRGHREHREPASGIAAMDAGGVPARLRH
jgi:transmembrane protein DUF3566